jgi:hypothetical protein
LILAVAVAAFLAATPGEPQCGLAHLELCRNTNVLAWNKPFVRAVRAFVGSGRASYLYHGSRADQQMSVLGGPPDDPRRIGMRYRFTACRPHSCREKGAVVLEPGGRIVATAILHSRCLEPKPPESCFDHNVLTLFVRDPAHEAPVIEDLTAWATSEIARETPFDRWAPPPRLETVEVYAAGSGEPRRVSVTSLAPR